MRREGEPKVTTIQFTQCDVNFEQDDVSVRAAKMPVYQRIQFYTATLLQCPDDTFATFDENFILLAQFLKRKGFLRELTLVSVCNEHAERIIETDADGDMLGEPHHGFFTQRLEWLR